MAIEAGDFKTGLTVMVDGDPWQVLDFMHVKPGKGAAILKTKMKNLKTGSTQERNFNANTKFEAAIIEKKEAQYSYESGGVYYFMDNETYDQLPLNKEDLGDTLKYLKENMIVKFLSFKGKVFAVEPPIFVELKVTYTEPGFAGNTAGAGQTKPAELETGYTINVPLFVNTDDVIRIDTRTGEYMERI